MAHIVKYPEALTVMRSQGKRGLFPYLWPDYAWVPSLGVTGATIKNIVRPGVWDGTFTSAVEPSWRVGAGNQGNGYVVDYATEEDSPITIGDIPDFQCLSAEPWTIVLSFSVANTASDDRALFSKYVDTTKRQLRIRVDKGAAPQDVEVWAGGQVIPVSSASIIELDTWYTLSLTNDGTAGVVGMALRIFDVRGSLLDTDTGQHDVDVADLTAPVEIWGRAGNDEFVGQGGPVYLYNRMLPLSAIVKIAQDNLAPVRIAKRVSVMKSIGAPPGGDGRRNPLNMPLTFPIGGPL